MAPELRLLGWDGAEGSMPWAEGQAEQCMDSGQGGWDLSYLFPGQARVEAGSPGEKQGLSLVCLSMGACEGHPN